MSPDSRTEVYLPSGPLPPAQRLHHRRAPPVPRRKLHLSGIAVILAQQLCFAVHHADGALMAGAATCAAAVAFICIYFDNFANHSRYLLKLMGDSLAEDILHG